MEDRNIIIKSDITGRVNLFDPQTRMDITWERKGAKRSVSLAKLREAIWSTGVANLFIDGALVIDEKDAFKIAQDLGLEDSYATEPTNLIILNDAQRQRLMTTAPMSEFKETFETLNYEQRQNLADYAIQNKLINFDKCEYIKTAIGTDIIQAIKLKDAATEK